LIKALVAALSLVVLTACSSAGADSAAKSTPSAGAGKTLPFAPPPPPLREDGIACPADVKQCPDGSFVSRNPASSCAFEPCPGASNP
jgi:hypothetical protein